MRPVAGEEARFEKAFFETSYVVVNGAFMILLVVSSLLWSASFGLIKSQVSSLDPFLVAAIRLALSALAFAPWLRRVRARLALELMAIGAVQFGLMYCAYIASYRDLAGHQIALLTTTTPILVVIIELGLARRWRTAPFVAAIVAVIGGLTVVYSPGAARPALIGLALVQASNLCFAAGQVWYRRAKRRHLFDRDEGVFGWLYIGAVLTPLVFLAVRGTAVPLPHTAGQWASLAYLGLIPSALAFFLWNKGVTQVSTGVAATMNNLKIPGGVLIAWLLFGESAVLWRLLVSGVLLGAALLLAREPASADGPGVDKPPLPEGAA